MTWTILHEACQYERTKEVLQRSDLHSEEAIMTDDHGWTPLHIACWSNPPASVVQALIHANPSGAKEKDVHGNTPLHIASSNPESSVEVAECMLNANPSSIVMKNMEGMMPLHLACRFASQNEALVRSLIEADPTALRTRTKMGYPATRKPSKNTATQHPVTDGVARSGPSCIDMRFQSIGEQVRDGSYPLHIACMSNAPLSVIQMLLDGAPEVVSWTNKFGETPLHLALSRGVHDDGIRMLLQYDSSHAALQIKEQREGNLPLHLAAQKQFSLNILASMIQGYPESRDALNNKGNMPFALLHVTLP